jgi:hypothetical protein
VYLKKIINEMNYKTGDYEKEINGDRITYKYCALFTIFVYNWSLLLNLILNFTILASWDW